MLRRAAACVRVPQPLLSTFVSIGPPAWTAGGASVADIDADTIQAPLAPPPHGHDTPRVTSTSTDAAHDQQPQHRSSSAQAGVSAPVGGEGASHDSHSTASMHSLPSSAYDAAGRQVTTTNSSAAAISSAAAREVASEEAAFTSVGAEMATPFDRVRSFFRVELRSADAGECRHPTWKT